MADVLAPDPSAFAPIDAEVAERWGVPGPFKRARFPTLVGLQLEEIRVDYARMRLPYRDELTQPAGVVHGGAIATLIDTVVVPAIASAHDAVPQLLTLSMSIQYLGAVTAEDLVGEGWVTKRGRSVVFCSTLVRTPSGADVATGQLVYKVRPG